MTLDNMPPSQPSNGFIGMDFSWDSDSHAAPYCDPGPANTGVSTQFSARDEKSRLAEAMSAFTNHEPIALKQDKAVLTVDPMNMWSIPDPFRTPSTTSRHDSANPSSATPKIEPPVVSSEIASPFQMESESTCRARHAANQRHRKARNSQSSQETSSTSGSNAQADEKKQRLREKNEVAAAKCRQRKRKQAEMIRAKGGRLSETNAQLKSYVQDLRQELSGLRAYALGHGDCDDRLARYNRAQADRLMAEYHSACRSRGSSTAAVTGEPTGPQ